MSLRQSEIAKFLAEHIAGSFPGFYQFDKTCLLQVRRPVLHGVCLDKSPSDDAFYVWCFVQFLTEEDDRIAFTMGSRAGRHDRTGSTWRIGPAKSEADDLLRALNDHPLSPFRLEATCGNLLRIADPERLNTHGLYGMGTCAVYENDVALAHFYFEKVREITRRPAEGWRLELLNRTEIIDKLLSDLPAAKTNLMAWVEESIHRLKLDAIA